MGSIAHHPGKRQLRDSARSVSFKETPGVVNHHCVDVFVRCAQLYEAGQHVASDEVDNVARLLGARWGALALVLDALKGMIPVLVAGRLLEPFVPGAPWWLYPVWLMVGLACVVGHILPVYLRLRGGKGVATSLGVVLGFWPIFTIPGLAALGVFVLVVLATRYVSLASMTAALAFPVAFFLLHSHMRLAPNQAAYFMPFAVFLPLVILWRHRANIRRLLAGRELRIGQSAPPDSSES